MKKNCLIFLATLIFSICLSSCFLGSEDADKSVVIQNNTNADIVFTHYSGMGFSCSFPFVVPSNGGVVAFSYVTINDESDFVFVKENKNYRGHTSYIQDTSKYVLVVSEENDKLYSCDSSQFIKYECHEEN